MTVTNTTAAECAKFLREYNAWRRNFDDAAMPNPTYIGMMIDAAAEALERESHAVGKVAQLELERDEIGEKLMVSDYALKDAERQRDALLAALRKAVSGGTQNICTHDETHRGGVIWEICNTCGAKWADDEGGKPEFKWPQWVLDAEAAIAACKPGATP